MKHLFFIFLLCVCSSVANAVAIDYTMSPPTTRDDVQKTPLALSEIASYKVYEYVNGVLVNTYVSTTPTIKGREIANGTITAKASVVDTLGQEGRATPLIDVKFPPGTPTGFSGKITVTVVIEQ